MRIDQLVRGGLRFLDTSMEPVAVRTGAQQMVTKNPPGAIQVNFQELDDAVSANCCDGSSSFAHIYLLNFGFHAGASSSTESMSSVMIVSVFP